MLVEDCDAVFGGAGGHAGLDWPLSDVRPWALNLALVSVTVGAATDRAAPSPLSMIV